MIVALRFFLNGDGTLVQRLGRSVIPGRLVDNRQ